MKMSNSPGSAPPPSSLGLNIDRYIKKGKAYMQETCLDVYGKEIHQDLKCERQTIAFSH